MPLSTSSVPILSLLLATGPGAAMLSCDKIRVDGFNFDLSHLAGPHSVLTSRYESIPKTHHNTTYTLDICKPLQKSGKEKAREECPNGTRVCAITRLLRGDTNEVSDVIAIAGSLENVGGSQFEYQATRLKTSDSNSDSQKEGLRLVLMGGKHPLDGPLKERREQKAIIELLCDPDKKGTEGEWPTSEAEQATTFPPWRRAAADEGGKDGHDGDGHDGDGAESAIEHQLRKEGAALIWESYQAEKEADVLRLTWHTKYACEKRDGSEKPGEEEGGGDVSRHWGFFTWFIIVAFLGIAAYLIFGSWLNYNRYGARGWDLVPHGDAIRDIPYLLKDWTRRVLNTVQGTGSRGGYSAV